MYAGETVRGIFSKKLNRFVAEVFINGEQELVHIKNTGRLKEILKPGAIVSLEQSSNPKRKTKYSIIAAVKNGRWINIDSQIPNTVVYEALQKGKIKEFSSPAVWKREVSFEGSRFDLFYEGGEVPGFIEVKGVTLETDGIAMFPDAPTVRGTKHVETLVRAKEAGYEAAVFFLIQMKGCTHFTPNKELDEKFTEALFCAKEAGVRLIAYDCQVTASSIEIDHPIPIIFPR